MKKFILFSVLFLGLSMVLIAQSPSNEQRLVGTWINNFDGSRVVFNSNGTMSGSLYFKDIIYTKYAVAEDKLVLMTNSSSGEGFDFRISSDGRTLIILSHHAVDVYSFKRQ
jgi:hypothetical protein